ncbi:MAG: glycine--tRNA ligase subunit beta [Deltaproteobacteria bacterium]|nr:glycine--tRNA ligase subunit beta [Deltaproteobacteria bacterium]
MAAIRTAELLLEIGTEEIPARMAPEGLSMLEEGFRKALAALGVGEIALRCFVTPRRLVLHAPALPVAQDDRTEEKRGPALSAAFGPDGAPTKAAEGFARSVGLTLDQLDRVETDKGAYLLARRTVPGRPLTDFLPGVVLETLQALRFPRAMRWGDEEVLFVRPVQWIVALFDGQVIPVTFGDVTAGRTTRGHRFHGAAALEVKDFAQYVATLEENGVMLDPGARAARIREGLAAVERDTGLRVVPDEGLLLEVTHLVEHPVVLSGGFDPRYLELPRETLITSMRHHQKYFAVEAADGRLAPRFAVVANTTVKDPAVVVRGNVRVLRARLEDAMFFLLEDRKRPLDGFLPDLEGQLFMKGLGTMAEKGRRLEALAALLAGEVEPGLRDTVRRAASLAKADLATAMVFEFAELQGTMGREYARHHGEPEAVALAIWEHYLPRGAEDALPATTPGALVAVADRLDTLAGTFGLGLVPTATKDPYALRRAALGLLRILLARGWSLPLSRLFRLALEGYGRDFGDPAEALVAKLVEFTGTRLRVHLAAGHATELVDAVLAGGFEDVPDVARRVAAIEALRGRPDYEPLIVAFKRVLNITKKQDVAAAVDPARFQDPQEGVLWTAFTEVSGGVDAACAAGEHGRALELLSSLKPVIDLYFDQVMVMCDDGALRANRLATMAAIGARFLKIADFTRILA